MEQLPQLDETHSFPDPDSALTSPNGLLAVGGDLEPQRIIEAYKKGIFPWYEQGQPLLWWSPDPRMVLLPEELHINRSLKKALSKSTLTITCNQAFNDVIAACSQRTNDEGTWITPDMIKAYQALHQMGFAHSVEAWSNKQLVGGLYGLMVGQVFCGESMFSKQSNASKIAFVHFVEHLKQQDIQAIDCQIASPYLSRFGAKEISRQEFRQYLP